MPLKKIFPLLLATGALLVSAQAKMPVMATYWSANKKTSDTVKAHYPPGVIPGTINRLILNNLKFQDFERLEATPLWKENLAEFKILRERGVEIWVAIGNDQRDRMDKAEASQYIKDLVDFCVRNDIDGVDLRLEGEIALNHVNYNGFCRELADALHAKNKRVSLAVHPHWTFPKVEDATLGKMDYVLAIAYDERGDWDKNRHGPHATFEFAQSAVAKVLERKVPANKILLGMPTYGYRWWTDKSGEKKAAKVGWQEILKKYPHLRDKDMAGPGPKTVDGVWHYNGLQTVRKKVAWANKQNLAGIGVEHGDYEVNNGNSFWMAARGANQ